MGTPWPIEKPILEIGKATKPLHEGCSSICTSKRGDTGVLVDLFTFKFLFSFQNSNLSGKSKQAGGEIGQG
jgi:hypothetical protein